MPFELRGKRVYVAGHRGMVGSALVRRLARESCEIITVNRALGDLRRQQATEEFFKEARPEIVFLAAAKVGGIHANNVYPVEFLYDNLMIETNVMEAASRSGVEKLVFLGSSCIYPKLAPQPISEDALLTGPLEPTNEAYAIAKIAGIKLAQAYRKQYGSDFISAQPTNLYGPEDNFDLENSHVLAALMRKAHEAKRGGADEMVVWGSGKPLREFMHVDDLADARVFLARNWSSDDIVNVGSGDELSIAELASLVCEVVGYRGKLRFDASKPDGTPRKRLDCSRLNALGWRRSIALRDGIEATYRWFVSRGPAALERAR
jgi:GDP-L-fucose synthase